MMDTKLVITIGIWAMCSFILVHLTCVIEGPAPAIIFLYISTLLFFISGLLIYVYVLLNKPETQHERY